MPDYSGVSKDRDIYGELGWIPNFNVKCSKNNNAVLFGNILAVIGWISQFAHFNLVPH